MEPSPLSVACAGAILVQTQHIASTHKHFRGARPSLVLLRVPHPRHRSTSSSTRKLGITFNAVQGDKLELVARRGTHSVEVTCSAVSSRGNFAASGAANGEVKVTSGA